MFEDNKADYLGDDSSITRRSFLKAGMGAGVSLATLATPLSPLFASANEKTIIVGAGLAGLTVGYELWKAGIRSTIYDAQTRVGGRLRTIRGIPGGLTTEAGAQFVETDHHEIRRLISELGLSLVNLSTNESNGKDVYFFNGEHKKWSKIQEDLEEVYKKAEKHLGQFNWPFSFRSADENARYWDSWSVAEWIDEYCPGGISGKAGKYLKVYFETLYAGRADDASAIHLISDLAAEWQGKEDERYAIGGGSDALTTALLEKLPDDTVQFAMPLVAINKNSDGRIACTFQQGAGTAEVKADRVVLALPFSILKNVDFSKADFEPTMQKAIQNLGMGANTKTSLLFNDRPWEENDFSGGCYSDLILGATWLEGKNESRLQDFLVCMNGAEFANALSSEPAHGPISGDMLSRYLKSADSVLGTVSPKFAGQAFLSNWPNDSWVKGSYSYYKRGGFTEFGGIEGKTQGNIFFAGEHTAPYALHGTMNGAVYSGVTAAKGVLRACGRP